MRVRWSPLSLSMSISTRTRNGRSNTKFVTKCTLTISFGARFLCLPQKVSSHSFSLYSFIKQTETRKQDKISTMSKQSASVSTSAICGINRPQTQSRLCLSPSRNAPSREHVVSILNEVLDILNEDIASTKRSRRCTDLSKMTLQ